MMKADIVPTLPTEVILHGRELTSAEVLAVARHYAPVSLGAESLMRINAARQVIDRLADEGQTVYGVTTGFGHLSRVRIPHEQLTNLQHNLLRSHGFFKHFSPDRGQWRFARFDLFTQAIPALGVVGMFDKASELVVGNNRSKSYRVFPLSS
jgi:Aromatic amino acid lyase